MLVWKAGGAHKSGSEDGARTWGPIGVQSGEQKQLVSVDLRLQLPLAKPL